MANLGFNCQIFKLVVKLNVCFLIGCLFVGIDCLMILGSLKIGFVN